MDTIGHVGHKKRWTLLRLVLPSLARPGYDGHAGTAAVFGCVGWYEALRKPANGP